jgi:murein DD-endopeptidase MepM/ murein hydrolase activator NlpD
VSIGAGAGIGAAVAVLLVTTIASATAGAVTAALPGTGGTPPAAGPPAGAVGAVSAAGWLRPVPGAAGSGFRTADRPHHDGVDLLAPRGTVIRAAAPGVVVTVECNAHLGGAPYPCDQDGGISVLGCGWYVEIRHTEPGGPVTRYCHMGARPYVHIGQTVAAGTPLGRVGSSGNSSGPHLHFETHTGYPAVRGNAVNPAGFMRVHGIIL